jgi:hypothetical protein
MTEFETESIFDDFVSRTVEYRGAKVHLLLATPSKGESLGIIRAVARYFEKFGGEVAKVEGETDEQRADRQEADLKTWDDYCQKVMLEYVSLEKPLKRRMRPGQEPKSIDSPEELYTATDRAFCTTVVMHLHSLCLLGDTASKSSGSLSTSTVGAGRPSESSVAPATTPATESSRSASTAEETIDPSQFSVPV